MKKIINGMIHENPLFVLLLGLCSTLAVSTNFEKAYLLGFSVLVVLILTNVIVSLTKRFIGKSVETPALILIIGSFVTILEMILKAYIPALHQSLGIYLSLIVVNCIILGRAIQVGMKETLKNSFLDSLGVGLGFLFSISIIGLIREILGNGTITLMDTISSITGSVKIIELGNNSYFPISFFTTPAGAFITVGLLLGIVNTVRRGKHESN